MSGKLSCKQKPPCKANMIRHRDDYLAPVFKGRFVGGKKSDKPYEADCSLEAPEPLKKQSTQSRSRVGFSGNPESTFNIGQKLVNRGEKPSPPTYMISSKPTFDLLSGNFAFLVVLGPLDSRGHSASPDRPEIWTPDEQAEIARNS